MALCSAALGCLVMANVLPFQGCGTRSRMTWLPFSYFHVGLVCSLSPEQEGPGGVGACVCTCEAVGRLKQDTHMSYFFKELCSTHVCHFAVKFQFDKQPVIITLNACENRGKS